jgi:hypothetical protein
MTRPKFITKFMEDFHARVKRAGVNPDITDRWEKGIEHNPQTEKLYDMMDAIDWLYCDNFFGWKSGGDGDNGEFLKYELDIIFDLLDLEGRKIEEVT